MFKSIRSLVYLSFIIVGISLFLVMAMGVRQSQLSNRYSEITSLSERILFSYGTIREQITEALIGGDYLQIKSIIPDIEQLNNNVTLLYDNEVIPVQYKLTMAETINLSGLVIGLRKLDATEQKQKAGFKEPVYPSAATIMCSSSSSSWHSAPFIYMHATPR